MGRTPFLLVPLLAAAAPGFLATEAARTLSSTSPTQNQRLPPVLRRSLQEEEATEITGCGAEVCNQCVKVPVHFHFLGLVSPEGSVFLPHPTPTYQEYLADPRENLIRALTPAEEMIGVVTENLSVLNRAFEGTPFRFTLVGRSILDDEGAVSTIAPWTNDMLSFRKEMAFELGRGGLESLNVYLSYRISADPNATASGFATFPSYQATTEDGIWTTYDRLSGGGDSTNDLGFNLVQLVGRWMGLYSTFATNALGNLPVPSDDICGSLNEDDYVDDTPVHAEPNATCLDFLSLPEEELPVTCPGAAGPDPIFNYMSSVDDEVCWLERGAFTCGQIERMRSQWGFFRERKDAAICEDDDSFLARLEIRFGEAERLSLRTTRYTLEMEKEEEKGIDVVDSALEQRRRKNPRTRPGNNEDDGLAQRSSSPTALFVPDNIFRASSATGEVLFDSERDHDGAYSTSGLQDSLSVALCLPREGNFTLKTRTYNLGDGGGGIALEGDGDVTLLVGEEELSCGLGPQQAASFTINTIDCNGEFLTDSTYAPPEEPVDDDEEEEALGDADETDESGGGARASTGVLILLPILLGWAGVC